MCPLFGKKQKQNIFFKRTGWGGRRQAEGASRVFVEVPQRTGAFFFIRFVLQPTADSSLHLGKRKCSGDTPRPRSRARAAAGPCLPLWERPMSPRAEPFAFQAQRPDVPSERTAERAKSDAARQVRRCPGLGREGGEPRYGYP